MKTKQKPLVMTRMGLIVAIMVMIGFAVLYWTQLRGIWPSVRKPEQNIVSLIERATTTQPEGPLRIPKGFSLSVFAKDLGDPRVLAFTPSDFNLLLASIPARGTVVALIDKNKDGTSDETKTIVAGLNKPHGISVQCAKDGCKLYIAEENALVSYDYDPITITASGRRVIAPLPEGGVHITRTLLPQGRKMLVSVGSSCNVCQETDPKRASILEIDIVTGETKTFATGLRNSVFMAINPHTGAIWATEMGRDFLGDDLPPDEINIIKKDRKYGWPICYGKNIHDTEFDKNVYFRNPCMEPFETPSHIDIPAHSAPLGLAFIPNSWPSEYRGDLLVAYHGSWNRSVPTGYKIVRYRLDEQGNYKSGEDFITGWLTNNYNALGRPVDILIQEENGTTYISDDKAGVVYRLIPPK